MRPTQRTFGAALVVCSWCGNDSGDLAVGQLPDSCGMRVIINDQPCQTCKDEMARGITFIEATKDAFGKVERTGRWSVVTEEGARGIINGDELLASVLKCRKTYMETETYERVFGRCK